MKNSIFSFIILSIIFIVAAAVNEEFVAKLEAAKLIADNAIQSIYKEWQIDQYPNFLKSCSMHKSSWDLLKSKFMQRVLGTVVSTSTPGRKDFVISFLGSSVAAGHDSFFNQSYPIIVGDLMTPVFAAMGITLDSRNVALGNNPCMPYDICAKIFAGLDADIVHWEQTYNCGDNPIMEQFVRQSMTIPTQPVIVFSESTTAHWSPDKCKQQPPPHVINDAEKELLASAPMKIVSELNRDEFKRAWNILHDISKTYRGAGIQTFTHVSHEPYACLGPYIKDWEKGAAAWHPSVIAHRLRAAHHSYWWLLAWKDALTELISLATHRPLDGMLKDITKHISSFHRSMPAVIHKTPVLDSMTCYSDYEPRYIREASLKGKALGGITSDPKGNGWKSIIYEDLVHENLVKQGLKMGYKDFKHLLYADSNSGPLSILITVSKQGPLFVCETPGIWGALPEGFKHLWESDPAITLTMNVEGDGKDFVYSSDKAEKQEYVHEKELEICMQMKKEVTPGQHVLTITPSSSHQNKIILAWVIAP